MTSLEHDRSKSDGLFLCSPGFDGLFIFGTLAVALTLGALASISSAMLMTVVFLNIWLFANPHVIATYTRIGSSKLEIRKNWFLIFLLPLMVLVGVTVIALAYEVTGLFTFYLLAQTYHVCRQSFGIARGYRRIDPQPFRPDRLSEGIIYLFPFLGLLNWCAQAPEVFLGYPIKLPIVSPVFVQITAAIAVGAGAWWVIRQCHRGIRNRHDFFVTSHVCVFSVAYLWISDITLGWLIVNIWHNVQYLLFVWSKNIKRDAASHNFVQMQPFSNRINASLGFPWKNVRNYLLLCLLFGAILYEVFDAVGRQFPESVI